MTAIVDMFPNQLRKDKRREMFIALVCLVSFIIGLSMITNVSKCLFISSLLGALPSKQIQDNFENGWVGPGLAQKNNWKIVPK